MDFGRQLAEVLRQLRHDARLTQTAMAKRLGVSQPTLNRLEHAGQNTTLKTLAQLCRVLDCSIGELFEGRVVLKHRGRHGRNR